MLELAVSGFTSAKRAGAIAKSIANGDLVATLLGERAVPGASTRSGGSSDKRFVGVRCMSVESDPPGAAREGKESKEATKFRRLAIKKLFGEIEAGELSLNL